MTKLSCLILLVLILYLSNFGCDCYRWNSTPYYGNSSYNHNGSYYHRRFNRQAEGTDTFDWYDFYEYSIIESFLKEMATKFSDLCELKVIGTTYENRNLYVLIIGKYETGKRQIWIDGGIHAREWASPASVTYILFDLLTKWDSQHDYIRNKVWHIMPVVNPDGYAFSHTPGNRLWRKNRKPFDKCFGVDINRNFGYHFGGLGTSKNPCFDTHRGGFAFSEEESRAMKDYLSKLHPVPIAYLTYHTFGQYILYPFGYTYMDAPDYIELRRVGRIASDKISASTGKMYKVGAANMIGAGAGGSDDWAKGELGVKYVYTVELRDKGEYGFEMPRTQLFSTAREALIVAKTIASEIH